MKYEKPEASVVTTAVVAVRGGKPSSLQTEILNPTQPVKTANAYEADE